MTSRSSPTGLTSSMRKLCAGNQSRSVRAYLMVDAYAAAVGALN